MTFKFIAEPTAAFAALMAGDVDAFVNYPAPESFAQFAADPAFPNVLNGTTEMEVVLGLNERIPALRDLRVRRAISYAHRPERHHRRGDVRLRYPESAVIFRRPTLHTWTLRESIHTIYGKAKALLAAGGLRGRLDA